MVHPYFNLPETESVSPAVAANAITAAEILPPNPRFGPKADLIEIDAQCLDHPEEIFDSYLWEGKLRGNEYEAKNVRHFGRYTFNLETAFWSQKSTAKIPVVIIVVIRLVISTFVFVFVMPTDFLHGYCC
jgi:hypothetical protein